jgi:curved DNA-binding protein CbpA
MNPFTALHLPASPERTDDQVREAWRAIAARTHPDRGDGGNPAAYTAAAAAYAQLRTPWGRSEALADLALTADAPPPEPIAAGSSLVLAAWRALAVLPARMATAARYGWPYAPWSPTPSPSLSWR